MANGSLPLTDHHYDRPALGETRCRRLALLLLTVHAALLAWGAYRHSPTYDEVAYLPAGVSHWMFGRFDLASVSPPLVRTVAAIPVVLAQPQTDWRHYDRSPSPRAAHLVGKDFAAANGERTFWLFTLARWACIPFSLIGGYVCYAWGRDLYGPLSGLLACGLWCFSPNILGHGQLMTPDVGTAALGIAAAYTFWSWLQSPTWPRAIWAGLVLGLAQLAKSTLVIFLLLWPLLWLLRLATNRRRVGGKKGTFCFFVGDVIRKWNSITEKAEYPLFLAPAQLAAILLLGLYVLNLGYGFQGSFQRLGEYRFVSSLLSGDEHGDEGNRFANWGLGWIPVPLPENYLRGVDFQKRQLENRGGWQRSYLRGEWRDRGWWYYYLYGLMIKVPLGTWALAGLSVILRVRERRAGLADASGFDGAGRSASPEWVLIVPPLAILVLVSSQTGFNHHLRYVLPAFPFAFVWMSRAGQWGWLNRPVNSSADQPINLSTGEGRCVTQAAPALDGDLDSCDVEGETRVGSRLAYAPYGYGSENQVMKVATSLAVVWLLASSLKAYPHSLSYFNELAGGPERGHAHLIDSNIDWGQDLLYLRDWLREHPDAAPMSIAYFGNLPIESAGISAPLPPGGGATEFGETDYAVKPRPEETPRTFGPQPGWYAVSVNYLRGVTRGLNRDLRYFLTFTPVDRVGYSILIYHITPEEADRVRGERGLPPLGE